MSAYIPFTHNDDGVNRRGENGVRRKTHKTKNPNQQDSRDMAKSVERNHPDFDIKQDDLLNLQPVESWGDLKKGSFLVYYRMTLFDANGVRGDVVHLIRVDITKPSFFIQKLTNY